MSETTGSVGPKGVMCVYAMTDAEYISKLQARNAKLVVALKKARTYSGALNYMRAPEFIRLIDEALANQPITEKL